MTDAPEHIWLLPHDGEQRCWCVHPDPSGMGHEDEADEYIRADLVEALEVEIDRLRKALKEIDHGDGWGWCGQIARAALRKQEEG